VSVPALELDERYLTLSRDSIVLGGASAYTVLGVIAKLPAVKAAIDAATLYLSHQKRTMHRVQSLTGRNSILATIVFCAAQQLVVELGG
jgi:hypothetical protein